MLPYMQTYTGNTITQKIDTFGGLNRNNVIPANEFQEMKNCTSKEYPCIAPRKGRTTVETLTTGGNVYCFDGKLTVIDGTDFIYDGTKKATLSATGPKQVAYMNKYIVIFPDKIYYDTINDTVKHMEIECKSTTSGQFTFENNKIIFNSGTLPAFEVGDAINITGCSDKPYNNRIFVIVAVGSNYFQTTNNTFEEVTAEQGLVTLKRNIPDLSYITEFNNRLWGCDTAGTIYCSKLGSFNNFNYYQGLATDSYYVEVGSQGNFTGVAGYNGHLYFFKEDVIHVIYGFSPSEFQIIDITSLGVKEGAYKTIAVTNNLLFYLSRDGIMLFDGTAPALISKKLGDIVYTSGAAGGNRQFYYISLQSGTEWHLYVYDSDRAIWTMQDNTQADNFTTYKGEMLYLDHSTKKIMKTEQESSDEVVNWEAITGDYNMTEQEKKAAMRLLIRAELDTGSTLSVSVKRNGGQWQQKAYITGKTTLNHVIPIKPLRCESFQIKLSGSGPCKVYSITRQYTERSYT